MKLHSSLLAVAAGLVIMTGSATASPQSMSFEEARVLLARAGFDPRDDEVKPYVGMAQADAARKLVTEASKAPLVKPESLLAEGLITPAQRKGQTREQHLLYRQTDNRQINDLRNWWLQQMVQTPTPLTERMVLFWHGHFANSNQKVKSAQWMALQQIDIRRNALGDFRTLLADVAKSPSMMVYLDVAGSRKQAANENFAREVMELFTLGEGHYSEQDIKQAAKAFTGWSIDPQTGMYVFKASLHDDSVKTIFGKSGNYTGDDVLKLLLEQPDAARFIVGKLWREFVSPTPDSKEVERIASHFRTSNYSIATAVTDLLSLPILIAPENRGSLVKSPIDLTVGAVRRFDIKVTDFSPIGYASAVFGQNLFAPPNVKGWPGNEDWINASSLLARKQFLVRLLSGVPQKPVVREDLQGKMRLVGARLNTMGDSDTVVWDSNAWLTRIGVPPGKTLMGPERSKVELAVLSIAPISQPDSSLDGASMVRALSQDPAFQVK
jgi:uncharacterized protein (DUF1800 family)